MKRAPTRRAEVLLLIALGIATAYVAYAVAAFVLQGHLIFVGQRRGRVVGAPPVFAGVERVAIATPTGLVDALYLAPEPAEGQQRATAILYAHGNAELIEDWHQWFAHVRPTGVAVLIVEYPGYGRSAGGPSQASVRDAMLAAHDWLSQRAEIEPSRIVGYGRSLGGGAVCTLIGQRPLAALILSSTFTSLRPFAAGMLLPAMLVRHAFDNLAAVRTFKGPVLVIHGQLDELVPFSHGQALVAAAQDGQLLVYPAGHNNCPPDAVAFAPQLEDFFLRHGLIGKQPQ